MSAQPGPVPSAQQAWVPQTPQSPGQSVQVSVPVHVPSPQTSVPQGPQSVWQVLQSSPGSHTVSPQTEVQVPQSCAQLPQVSVPLQVPSPQTGPVPGSWQVPPLQISEGPQLPHEPPQPSSPQVRPLQLGTQAQAPLVQISLAAQVAPQLPQWASSTDKSRQAPPHAVMFDGQAVAQLPIAQS